MKAVVGLAGLGLVLLAGCGNFFVKQSSTGGGGGGGGTGGNTAAGDVLYTLNSVAGSISAYVVSTTGALTPAANSPYMLGIIPTSISITPGNTFLYVGYANGVLGYSIGSNGVLTALNNSQPLATDVIAPLSMQVDATGGYLLAAAEDLGTTLPEIAVYSINTSTGGLTAVAGSPLSVAPGNGATNASVANVPNQICITPANTSVYLTLGSGGTEILNFSAGNGALTDTATHLNLDTTGSAQVNVVSNANSTVLYVTETGTGVRAFAIGASGALTEVAGSPFAAGTGPSGMTLDSTGDYLYVANKGSSNITGFSVGGSGALTALGSSPTAAGRLPLSLSLDQSKKFLAVANSGGTPDLGVYAFDATTIGKLNLTTSETAQTPLGSSLVVGTH